MDERLCEFEQTSSGRQIRSVFHQESSDLTDAQRARLLNETVRVRPDVNPFCRDRGRILTAAR